MRFSSCFSMWVACVLPVLCVGCASAPAPQSKPESSPPTNEVAPKPLALLSSTVRFAEADEAAALLSSADEFTRSLSAFDRQLRTKRTDNVSDADFRAHCAEAALSWTRQEQAAWESTVKKLHAALAGMRLPLPAEVVLVRTDGREEFDANYTRQNAIVLPRRDTLRDDAHRFSLLAHELFHVASRQGKDAFRDAAYGLLGYVAVDKRPWPADLEARRITNPDAHTSHHAVNVMAGDESLLVVPSLTSKVPIEQAVTADPLFSIVELQLLVTTSSAWVTDAKGARRRSVAGTDYMKTMARNTHYVLHPEEVLADNFALLARRREGRSSEVKDRSIVDALEALLSKASDAEP